MFALKLFGGVSFEADGTPLPPAARQRRRLTLLAVLALAGRRGISRDRIQALLWPDAPPERARHALDQLLYVLRRDLGQDVALVTANEIRLNSASVRADTTAFDDAIEGRRFEDAVELYAGPVLDGLHLVDGGEFEHWLDGERTRRQHAYHDALETLAREARERGDLPASVRWWRRRAAADPLSAAVMMELMTALAESNDRASAVRHARAYQQLVRSTLDVEPDPAVEALTLRIKEFRKAPVASELAVTTEVRATSPEVTPPSDGTIGANGTLSTPTRRHRVPATAMPIAVALLVSAIVGFLAWSRPSGGAYRGGVAFPSAGGVGGSRTVRDAHGTSNSEARSLYLRARASWDKRSKDGLEEALVLYRRATERDPEYAAAHAGLAQSYAMLGYFGFASPEAMFPKARAAALHALRLDARSGEAYAALGQALAWQHAWAEAEHAYRRALELSPSDATNHQWYGLLLAYLGRHPEASVHTGHASSLDPLSVQINNMHGMMLSYAGDLSGALRQYERTVNAEPDSAWVRQNPWLLTNYARIAARVGRHAEALRLIERALEVLPTHPRPLLDLAYVNVFAGDTVRARHAFARADSTHPHYPIYIAMLHGLVGDLDGAFEHFDRVREWALPALVQLNGDPAYAKLRADPRFRRLRARLGMPPLALHATRETTR